MDSEFRTTFIPKKPIVQQSAGSSMPVSKPVGIIFVVAVIIFIVTLLIGGGAYLYKSYAQGQVDDLAVSLDKVQKKLDANTIKEFSVMDKRLKNSQSLLNQHNVISPVFNVLGITTLPTVRYTKLDVGYNEVGDLAISLSGESDGYRSIALQSQALTQNANLKDTIFSNFVVTPKGRVSFDLSFSVPKADIAFAKNLNSESQVPTAIQTSSVITEQSATVDDTALDSQPI